MADHTKAPLLANTPLKDRTLWFDGDSAYEPEKLLIAMARGDVKYVTAPSSLVDEYNKHVAKTQEILVKDTCNPLSYDWNIPAQYKSLDVVGYLCGAHDILFENDPEREAREIRLAQELVIYESQGLYDVLRAIIWIINTLTARDTVWGVGRGSSVSSYVLYVIGVHDVDSYAYNLDIDDFLHE